MPVLAKVSWQIGQLAFRITLQLMKQISFRQVISPALLLLTLSPQYAESILHYQDCAFRAQTSNSSHFLKARLSTTSYSHFCPTQGILKAWNSKLSPLAYDKKTKLQRPTDTFLNVDDGTQTQIKQSDCITAEDQSLSRSIDMFSDPERKSYKTPCNLYYLMCCSLPLVSILKYYMQN